jgi:hypothetical protein
MTLATGLPPGVTLYGEWLNAASKKTNGSGRGKGQLT